MERRQFLRTPKVLLSTYFIICLFVSSYSVGFHNAIEKAEHMVSRFLLFFVCLFVPIVFFSMFCLHTLQVDVNDTYGTYEYDTSYEQSDYSTVQDTNDYYEPTYDDM